MVETLKINYLLDFKYNQGIIKWHNIEFYAVFSQFQIVTV